MIANGGRSGNFDFIFGKWTVHNRKLRDVTDPRCVDWVEFDATSEAYPILGGLGHIDRMYVPEPVDGTPFEGFTLRLFDPKVALWSIWWSSTRVPGALDPPVRGRFHGHHGVFECAHTLKDRPVLMRFEWHADPSAPTWQQSFSFDDGATWNANWIMSLDRAA